MRRLPLLALLLPGCRTVVGTLGKGVPEDTAGIGRDTGAGDTGDDTGFALPDVDPDTPVPWCIHFEGGTLADVGWPGQRQVELDTGGIVVVVEEGASWSALRGEEALDLSGDHALVLRSSHDGRVDSLAVATTRPFRVTADRVTWTQLSEVDARGVALDLEVLDGAGAVLHAEPLSVETGGFVPGLEDAFDPIVGIPEIVVGPGVVGVPVAQSVDLSPWRDEELQLRFTQHTQIVDNGFFTLLDDVCADPTGSGLAGR
jgi:hypothetical protein